MAKKMTNPQRNYILISLGMLAFGILLFLMPEDSMKTICFIFGIFLLVYAVIHLVMYFFGNREDPFQRFDLMIGVIALVGGGFVLIKWKFIMMILPVALGIFIAISGLTSLATAFDLKRNGYKRWWIVLFFSLIGAILGIILIVNPFSLAKTLTIFMGVAFVIISIINLWQAMFMRKVQNKSDLIEIDTDEQD